MSSTQTYCSAIIPSIPTICYLLVCRCLTTCKRCLRPLVGSENLSFVTLLSFSSSWWICIWYSGRWGRSCDLVSYHCPFGLCIALSSRKMKDRRARPETIREIRQWNLRFKRKKRFSNSPPQPKKMLINFYYLKVSRFIMVQIFTWGTWYFFALSISKHAYTEMAGWKDGWMDGTLPFPPTLAFASVWFAVLKSS